jgi:hypothetical protein
MESKMDLSLHAEFSKVFKALEKMHKGLVATIEGYQVLEARVSALEKTLNADAGKQGESKGEQGTIEVS